MNLIRQSKKSIAALMVGIPAWGAAAQSGGITAQEWWGLVGVVATIVAVWLSPPNETME